VFTGLVQSLGRVAETERSEDGVVLEIATGLADEVAEGDSVAVNGVCLTAVAVSDQSFRAEVMNETLQRSALAALDAGSAVNLELAMRAGDRLGGHFVQGHVDGVGAVAEVSEDGFARRVRVEPPPELMRYVVHKGSITVDGVSLTVAELDQRSFTVSLIPETLERTTLGDARPGTNVNLEVDVLAKSVVKLVANSPSANSLGSPPAADVPGVEPS
jgi:riboflavin synthase